LFALRCQACHAAEKNGYGPAVSQFNKKNSSRWMYNFIKDAQTLIDAGDETVIQLYKQWGNKKHPAQDRLNEEQIRAIVQYLKR
jgi:mono/diheme cytochrome c family protein